jgi:hypothetical protein
VGDLAFLDDSHGDAGDLLRRHQPFDFLVQHRLFRGGGSWSDHCSGRQGGEKAQSLAHGLSSLEGWP